MKSKTEKILKWTPSVLVSLMITIGACIALTGNEQMVEASAKLGMAEYLPDLSIAEMVFVSLFLLSRTMKIGCLLLTAYFGGAIAAEISHGNIFIAPVVILALVWVGAYLREPSFFKAVPAQPTGFPAI